MVFTPHIEEVFHVKFFLVNAWLIFNCDIVLNFIPTETLTISLFESGRRLTKVIRKS